MLATFLQRTLAVDIEPGCLSHIKKIETVGLLAQKVKQCAARGVLAVLPSPGRQR